MIGELLGAGGRERVGAALAARFPGLLSWEYDRLVPRSSAHDLRLVIRLARGERREVAARLGPGASDGAPLSILIPRPEDDRALPVAAALGAEGRRAAAAVAGSAVDDCELVSYVPGRRATIRYGGAGATLYAKLRREADLPARAAIAALGARRGDPVVLPEREAGAIPRTSWFRGAAGTLLADLDAEAWRSGLGASGAALRWLHDRPAPPTPARRLADELAVVRKLAGRLVSLWQEGAAWIDRGGASLAPRIDALPAETPVPGHGDFHDRQVLIDGGRARILDLDGLAPAERSIDLGNFIAHIDYRLAARGESGDSAPLAAAFLAGYGGRIADGAVELSRAIALLRNLCLYALVPPRWRALESRTRASFARLGAALSEPAPPLAADS